MFPWRLEGGCCQMAGHDHKWTNPKSPSCANDGVKFQVDTQTNFQPPDAARVVIALLPIDGPGTDHQSDQVDPGNDRLNVNQADIADNRLQMNQDQIPDKSQSTGN